MFARIKRDVQVVFQRDPAARTVLEVLLCYPGIHALLGYRLSHWLWSRNFKLSARLFSHFARFISGIEIHPGAKIGEGFFIDHGMGVVIGETTEIDNDVTIYHGVTLGGTSWDQGKRHPTLGKNVVIGAGAKVLGPITVGDNAKVGSNAVVVKDVPEGSTVVGVPGRIVMGRAVSDDALLFPAYGQAGEMPDPVAKAVACVLDQVRQIDQRIRALEQDDAQKVPAITQDVQDVQDVQATAEPKNHDLEAESLRLQALQQVLLGSIGSNPLEKSTASCQSEPLSSENVSQSSVTETLTTLASNDHQTHSCAEKQPACLIHPACGEKQ